MLRIVYNMCRKIVLVFENNILSELISFNIFLFRQKSKNKISYREAFEENKIYSTNFSLHMF